MSFRPRWNLRVFLAFMLLVGCTLGIVGRRELERRRIAAAVKSLTAVGVQIRYDSESTLTVGTQPRRGKAIEAYAYGWPKKTFTAKDLQPLRELNHLETLHFGCPTISHDSITQLATLRNLKELHLSHFPVDDAMLESIANIASLRRLHIDNSQVTTNGIKYLTKLRKLQRLEIQKMAQPTTTLEGAGKHIAQLSKLQHLRLFANLTSDDLQALSTLKELRVLDLHVPQCAAKHIAEFSKCSQLERISIYRVNGSNATLEALGKITSLTRLNCALGRADDEGVQHLKSLKNLKQLGLIGTPVSEAVVDVLSDLPNLKQIKLKHPKMPGGFAGPKAPPWPAGAEGSGIYTRTDDGTFKEMTNAEVAKRGYW